jgi:hypothetical protein
MIGLVTVITGGGSLVDGGVGGGGVDAMSSLGLYLPLDDFDRLSFFWAS